MREKPLEKSLLFDFYGETLTDKQRELFTMYYDEDLSLSEIAAQKGITPQGVRDGIKRAEGAMDALEQKLGLVRRFGETARCAAALADEVAALDALNSQTLHSDTVAGMVSRMNGLLTQLGQEDS